MDRRIRKTIYSSFLVLLCRFFSPETVEFSTNKHDWCLSWAGVWGLSLFSVVLDFEMWEPVSMFDCCFLCCFPSSKFWQNRMSFYIIGCVDVVGCVRCDELASWEAVPEGVGNRFWPFVPEHNHQRFCWLCWLI